MQILFKKNTEEEEKNQRNERNYGAKVTQLTSNSKN